MGLLMKKVRYKEFRVVYIILVVVLSFVLGLYWDSPVKNNPSFEEVSGEEGDELDYSLLNRVKSLIDSKYVEEVTDEVLLYGALRGMVESLEDPYSLFLDPDESKQFLQNLSGSFEGIGAEIAIRDDVLTIVAPLAGLPAEKAGILPGDRVIKVDDTLTVDLNLNEAVRLIRGPRGTPVLLIVLRDGESKAISIVRDRIDVHSVSWKMLDNGIAYIDIDNFHDDSLSEFMLAVNEMLLFYQPRGLVLDLRSNPGGFLERAISITSWFLDRDEVVVVERDGDGKEKKHLGRGPGTLKDYKVIVLVNRGSASASEILAGALRDNRDVKLVGEKTFGKGSVQELQDLPGASQLRITIAKWFTPNGHSIHNEGLEVDIEVEMTVEDFQSGLDPQLDRAVLELEKGF